MADPIDIVILALRLLLVGCLYGFLVAVVRLAAGSLRTAGPVAAAPAERSPGPEGARVPALRLVVVEAGSSGLPPGQAFEVAERAVLGRANTADLVLPDGAVSSEHARVERMGRSWVITDLGSTNGTRLNGAAVPANGHVAVAAGDVLTVGTVQLRISPR